MKIRIPLAKPEITEADREAVLGVLRTSSLSMGPKLQEFEQAICDYTGSKHAVAVNSGTSALQIAIHCLGLEHGAEVILPSFSFAALLNGILQEGLQPKFVDIDPETYNTTPDLVAAAITERTQLIIAVHTFGIPVDGEGLFRLIENPPTRPPRQGIHFIEDACEALGAEVYGRRVGSFGDAGTFAFYPNKQITTGEGGVLITSNHELATRAPIAEPGTRSGVRVVSAVRSWLQLQALRYQLCARYFSAESARKHCGPAAETGRTLRSRIGQYCRNSTPTSHL
jgi:perosamine synthetase